jgi:hypothetical protein
MSKLTPLAVAAVLLLVPFGSRAQKCPQVEGSLARYQDVMQKTLKDREDLCAQREKTGKPLPAPLVTRLRGCFQQLDPCLKKETPVAFEILKSCVYTPGILSGNGLCKRWSEVEACSQKAANANKEQYLDQTMKNAGMLGELFERFELCVRKTVATYK